MPRGKPTLKRFRGRASYIVGKRWEPDAPRAQIDFDINAYGPASLDREIEKLIAPLGGTIDGMCMAFSTETPL